MSQKQSTSKASWAAIWAMTLGISGIMIGEFLPAGLLTPMASELGISEGMAGQAVTATSIFAVLASLLTAYVSRNADRRKVLLLMSALMAISSAVVALSSNFAVLLFGRTLLGVALGGAWSLSTSLAIRLVGKDDVPKALGIIHSGASLSAVLAAPLGSFLGNLIGWRHTFLCAAGLGAIAFITQWFVLPRLKPLETVRLRTTLDVLRKPSFLYGLLAIALAFCGRFASFTYMRPFLENVTGFHGSEVSLVFMVFDLAYFFGTLLIAKFVGRHLKVMLTVPPLLLAAACLGLIGFGSHSIVTIGFIILLGAAFAPIPIAWSSWSAAAAPENTETAGGLFVAAVQLSAAIGAVGGGLMFDLKGSSGVYVLSAASWIASALLAYSLINIHAHQVKVRPA
jgi:predicted MFS family arabinose efflux permease